MNVFLAQTADLARHGEHVGEGITNFGKALAFGLALGLAAAGAGIGIGIAMVFSKAMESVTRQPEASGEVKPIMWMGFALVEAVVFYALVGAMLAHSLI
jgi:F-type H+-transporting ATPase subunit c